MTRKEALAELIAKVEAGVRPAQDGSCYKLFGDAWVHVYDIHHNGSLDAAKALREAVLTPDFVMSSDSTGYAHLYRDEHECTHTWDALLPGQQARAELLAILRAIHAMEPSE